ncbi:hypothetical protein BH11ACT5_BH11ACT5_11810 [soil metagenome]
MASESLLISMSGIAELARVQRPVVTTWRSRAASTGAPFPAPAKRDGGQDLFQVAEVTSWLTKTGRGNNNEVIADGDAHAYPTRHARIRDADVPPITSLLALRRILGGPVAGLSREDLIDLADEYDPDDQMLYREIASIQGRHARFVRYVDDAVEAGYGEAFVFDRLIAKQVGIADSAVSSRALELLTQVCVSLASTDAATSVVDVTGSGTDVLLAVAAAMHSVDLVVADSDDSSIRLQRRRLAVHDMSYQTFDRDADDSFGSPVGGIHLIQLPVEDSSNPRPAVVLSSLDQLIMKLNSTQLAVVMAPAALLADGNLDGNADGVRAGLLRSGRVRAVVRLPAGILIRKPRQAQALWIVGDAHANIDRANQWTMVADLSGEPLSPGTITALMSDLVASLGDSAAVRAHAFRLARLSYTRTLVANSGSLVAGARGHVLPSTPGAELAVRIELLLSELGEPGLSIETVVAPTAPAPSTVQQQIRAGHLRYVQGNRIVQDDIAEAQSGAPGFRVIGPAEVLGERVLGGKRIDRLRFAANYPSGRVTEPGDVVFCTTPSPAAIVDLEGTSVVAYPARILRIDRSDPNGLLPEVVAADIAAAPSTDKQWKTWFLRRSAPHQRGDLVRALSAIRLQHDSARARLSRLDELSTLLIAGTTAGSISLTPLEGTH